MKIQVFGQLTDIVGTKVLELDPVSDTDSLRQLLLEKYPLLKQMKFMVAADNAIIKGNVPLNARSSIALLPPFSGG